jgi:DNA repair exonuclease SbcCD ATPase subunit
VNETGFMKDIEAQISQHKEQLEAEAEAIQATKQSEAERVEQELRLAEQLAEEQRLKKEAAKRKEIEELAQRAQEARLRRLEEEQRAIDEEAEADKALLALVPVKGADGVRSQIDRMRTALKDDKKALDIALGSLYTLFDQIVRKPEEVNFRRIRRDHPKFMEDIGRHVGGQEVLIAAGFRLEKLDGVPCFFSKEPHIESDMDGWSDWFDGMKKYLEIVEDEMIK